MQLSNIPCPLKSVWLARAMIYSRDIDMLFSFTIPYYINCVRYRKVAESKMYSTVLVFVICFTLSYSAKVYNSTELKKYLCKTDYQNTKDIDLELNAAVYNLSGQSVCSINTTGSFNLHSYSGSIIRCDSDNIAASGIIFSNLRSLALKKITLQNCGVSLNDQILSNNILLTKFKFSENNYFSLMFLEVQRLSMQDVHIDAYHGYAVLDCNTQNSHYSNVTIKGHHQGNTFVGSGILILLYGNIIGSNVTIRNIVFTNNFDLRNKDKGCLDYSFYNNKTRYPLVNAAGLSVICYKSSLNLEITDSEFENNMASVAGAIVILPIETVSFQMFMNRTYFSNMKHVNNACRGAYIVYYSYNVKTHCDLVVENSNFTDASVTGAVNIGLYRSPLQTFVFRGIDFTNNSAAHDGACMYATMYQTQRDAVIIVLEDINATGNSQTNLSSSLAEVGIFTFVRISNVIMNGSSVYKNNYGSVIVLLDSIATLNGHLTFEHNVGFRGSAFKLIHNSSLVINENLTAVFNESEVQTLGGAIYACTYDFSLHQCPFQVNHNIILNITSFVGKIMYFNNNSAVEGGSSIYANRIYKCRMYHDHANTELTDRVILQRIYNQIFSFDYHANNSTQDISTVPEKLKLCEESVNTNLTFYPGQTQPLHVAALDANNNIVFSSVYLDVVSKQGVSLNDWYIKQTEKQQLLVEYLNTSMTNNSLCTKVNVTLFHKKLNMNTKLNVPKLVIRFLFNHKPLHVDLHLMDCPVGFVLDKFDTCKCSRAVQHFSEKIFYVDCNIQSVTLRRVDSANSWAGVYQDRGENRSVFGIAISCHQFCNLSIGYHFLMIHDNITYIAKDIKRLDKSTTLCLKNREGPLCSKCAMVNGKQTSVVFGSSECRHCSNLWLFTVVLYIALGPLMVYLFSKLKLTLASGTLNGIIFYTQTSIFGTSEVFRYHSTKTYPIIDACAKFALWFLLVTNLSPGLPVCLYDGMDEFWKISFGLLFPVYLLSIVVFLIIASHFSVRLSNNISRWSVQVLVTIVHLSLTNLIEVLVLVYTPIDMYIDVDTNGTKKFKISKVWMNDGAIEFGSGKHLILMIVTVLVVGGFILPYAFVLLGGKYLLRCGRINKYLLPVHEAIHAPYKRNKQYWFTARLLLVIYVGAFYAKLRGPNISALYSLVIIALTLFTIAQAYSSPFRNKILNALDLFIMVLSTSVTESTRYFVKTQNILPAAIITTLGVFVIFFIFITVLIYHTLVAVGYLDVVISKIKKAVNWCYPKNYYYESLSPVYRSVTEFREPLLSPTTSSVSMYS